MAQTHRSPAPCGGRASWNVHASERPQDNANPLRPQLTSSFTLRVVTGDGGAFVCIERTGGARA
jgi:hypothetical protein